MGVVLGIRTVSAGGKAVSFSRSFEEYSNLIFHFVERLSEYPGPERPIRELLEWQETFQYVKTLEGKMREEYGDHAVNTLLEDILNSSTVSPATKALWNLSSEFTNCVIRGSFIVNDIMTKKNMNFADVVPSGRIQ